MTFHVKRSNRLGRQRWFWRVVADNGRIVATSGERYTNRAHCIEMANKVAGGSWPVVIDG